VLFDIIVALVAGLALVWVLLVVVLLAAKPDAGSFAEAARLIPDIVRLVHRLARHRDLHRGVRLRLWLLVGYLALPIDLIPDFIPIVGYADDAIVTSLVLRSVIKRAGTQAVTEQWPGTAAGLAAFGRAMRLPGLSTS
jgi:uncharacterized membrane protein YkvA (DUF1232 family)